ncbi:MAG: sulfotransferase family protein [Halioglobus sp.]
MLGAHRSGTSVAAGACDALGAVLGQRFIAASEENPRGFFEDEDIVQLNDRLLRSAWLSWDALGYVWQEDFSAPRYRSYHARAVQLLRERFSGQSLAAMKDPRLCILLPFWQAAVREALDADVYYVLAVRHPAHCARSQKARNSADDDFHLIGKRREHVLLLWATYMYQALLVLQAEADKLLVMDYEATVAAPADQLARLASFLSVPVEYELAQDFAARFVDAGLNRSTAQGSPRRQWLPDVWRWTESVYELLREFDSRDTLDQKDVQQVIDDLDIANRTDLYLRETQHMYGYAYKKVFSLRHRLIRCIHEIGDVQRREHELKDSLAAHQDRVLHLEAETEELEGRIQEILDSRAWKFILRLRAIKAAAGFGLRERED